MQISALAKYPEHREPIHEHEYEQMAMFATTEPTQIKRYCYEQKRIH